MAYLRGILESGLGIVVLVLAALSAVAIFRRVGSHPLESLFWLLLPFGLLVCYGLYLKARERLRRRGLLPARPDNRLP